MIHIKRCLNCPHIVRHHKVSKSLKIVPHQRILSWSRIFRDHKVSKLAPDCSTSKVLQVVNTQLAKLFNITRFRSRQEFDSFVRGDIVRATFWSSDIIVTGHFLSAPL